MALVITFLLGIFNFTAHRAVLESGHPLFDQFAAHAGKYAAQILLLAELALLIGALTLVYNGYVGWAWGYAIYSASNYISAWMVLTGRI